MNKPELSKRRAPPPRLGLGDWPRPYCGVDEAGRGPWAGPVVAAAVILGPEIAARLRLDDSKKLTPARRADLAARLHEFAGQGPAAAVIGVGTADAAEVDALNIWRATEQAMRRAVAALGAKGDGTERSGGEPAADAVPVLAVVDGSLVPDLGLPVRTLIGGDGRDAAVAAASIIAKTQRDAIMLAADAVYPGYGFAAHKGYGVAAHRAALREWGPCPLHRLSFAPVREAIAAWGLWGGGEAPG